MEPLDVLIAGAGPTGLTLACYCQRLGLRTRIIERKTGPSQHSKAIGLQYRVSELLACLGVVDRFIARGGSPTAVNIYAGSKSLVRLQFSGFGRVSGRDAFEPRAIMISQRETELILGELLVERGGTIEWQTELLEFTQDDHAVVTRVRQADGREACIESRWLVSCEGAHSRVRKLAGLDFAGKPYSLAFWMADAVLSTGLDHGENHVWMHPAGSVAALPLPGNLWRLFVEVTRQVGQIPNEVSEDAIQQLLHERCPHAGLNIQETRWLSDFRPQCRMVERFRAGRVFLAGDAAHIHSPTGGQGIVTGMQDAANLAWKLARVLRGAPASLLDTYEEERLPAARDVLHETDRTTKLFVAPTLGLRLLRDFLVLPLLRSRWVQHRMFARLAQLHVNYRESRLSQDARGWGGKSTLQAGDRAPDVAFQVSCSGERSTLFGLLQRGKIVVLLGTEAGVGVAQHIAFECQDRDVECSCWPCAVNARAGGRRRFRFWKTSTAILQRSTA